jgi:hypothetical protein
MKRFALGLTAAGAFAVAASGAMAGGGPTAFPASTTIYIIPGVVDDGGAANAGVASTVTCTNVSGVNVNIRVAAFTSSGTNVGDATLNNIPNAGVRTFSTHATTFWNEDAGLNTGEITQGLFNVEATNANVFCTGTVESASSASPLGWDLHVVRVNGAAGVVE